ncbi:hypothetical protein Ccrd_008920, partial [Cynara cardunculus var. scolymus]
MRGMRSLIVHYWWKPMSRGLILTETRGGEAKQRERLARALLKRPFTKSIEGRGFLPCYQKGGWVKQTPSLDEHGLSQVEPGCAAGCSDRKEISRAMPRDEKYLHVFEILPILDTLLQCSGFKLYLSAAGCFSTTLNSTP